MWFHKKERPPAVAVQTRSAGFTPSVLESVPLETGETHLYKALRESVPIIDAAIEKLQRLVGSFMVQCSDPSIQRELDTFLREVRVNCGQYGIQSFLNSYLSQLLTFGNAIGEIVLTRGGKIAALYNASLDDVELRRRDALTVEICRRESGGPVPVRYPELVLFGALNPPPGEVRGVSLLRGLPFVGEILLQIFQSIGLNWERMGKVRFAVTYKPGPDAADRAFAKDRARQIAAEWGRAMQKGSVNDFVSVGDVSIRAIGADNQILDSNVPVRQLLEQIVAKLGLPPFLLGLSWSSTERMSSQQADILTSELESYRRLLDPVIGKICSLWLRLHGAVPEFTIEWDDITLQDATELANARLLNARAAQLEAGQKQAQSSEARPEEQEEEEL